MPLLTLRDIRDVCRPSILTKISEDVRQSWFYLDFILTKAREEIGRSGLDSDKKAKCLTPYTPSRTSLSRKFIECGASRLHDTLKCSAIERN